jgi:hypothetical protein
VQGSSQLTEHELSQVTSQLAVPVQDALPLLPLNTRVQLPSSHEALPLSPRDSVQSLPCLQFRLQELPQLPLQVASSSHSSEQLFVSASQAPPWAKSQDLPVAQRHCVSLQVQSGPGQDDVPLSQPRAHVAMTTATNVRAASDLMFSIVNSLPPGVRSLSWPREGPRT